MGSVNRFAYEWSKYDQIIPEYEIQFLKWVYPLKPKDFKNKIILDAGCGTGRNSYWSLTYKAAKVVAFDYNHDIVSVAKRNLLDFKNASVKYASIYDINYHNQFDIVMCIGVLHHLDNPVLAIKNLINACKKGGQVLFWVYGYEGNEKIVRLIDPLRSITSRIPLLVTHLLAMFISLFFYLYLKIVPQKHLYLKQLSHFKFWHIQSIIFDQLIPKIAHYWRREQVLNLFYNQPVRNIQIHQVNQNSWSLLATKT